MDSFIECPTTESSAERPQRAKLLLLAYACSPNHGSDEAVGWTWAVQAAKFVDTWVVCEQSAYEQAISQYAERYGLPPGLRFVFVEKPRWLRRLAKIPGFYYLTYNLWHRRAFQVVRRLHHQHRFDIVHQLNYCGYREPGYLWKLDTTFMWGPVGGTQNVPWRFLSVLSWRSAVAEALRTILNCVQLRFGPRVRRAAHRADVLLTANTTVQSDFSRVHEVDSQVLCEVQIPQLTGRVRHAAEFAGKLRLLWSGLFHEFKGLELLLRALADVPADVAWHLDVVGDGRCRRRWMRHAAELGLIDRITWHGWVPRAEAMEFCRRADVFVFTSLRDTTGTVMIEALAAGAPVICLDHQGARDVVTETCGIRVPVTHPAETVARLAEAVVNLAKDPQKLEVLSLGALARATDFMPPARDATYACILQRALNGGSGSRRACVILPKGDERSENRDEELVRTVIQ